MKRLNYVFFSLVGGIALTLGLQIWTAAREPAHPAAIISTPGDTSIPRPATQ